MKHMRKILSAVSVLSVTAVAGLNVSACFDFEPVAPIPKIEMSDAILSRLRVYDEQGKPQIKLDSIIRDEYNIADWKIVSEKDVAIDASVLLKEDGTAFNEDAKELLTEYFGLTADENGVFKKNQTSLIKFNYSWHEYHSEATANLVKVEGTNDLAVGDGLLAFSWSQESTESTSAKTLGYGTFKILGDPNKGVVNDALDLSSGFNISDFKIDEESPFQYFKIGGEVAKIKDGDRNVSRFLDFKAGEYSEYIVSLILLLRPETGKIEITEINSNSHALFQKGDSIVIQLTFDDVQFDHKYEIVLPAE